MLRRWQLASLISPTTVSSKGGTIRLTGADFVPIVPSDERNQGGRLVLLQRELLTRETQLAEAQQVPLCRRLHSGSQPPSPAPTSLVHASRHRGIQAAVRWRLERAEMQQQIELERARARAVRLSARRAGRPAGQRRRQRACSGRASSFRRRSGRSRGGSRSAPPSRSLARS